MADVEEYRRGYEDGVAARESPAGMVAGALLAPLDLFETEDYKRGYQDGINDREFNPSGGD